MLPDEPGTKVNQCVDNIMQIWRDGDADKLTQLVFCDISTPQAAPSKKAAKQLDNPLLHGLEEAIPLDEPEPAFTIYEDIRQKLIAQGMPADQIAFIHEANTEVRKDVYKRQTENAVSRRQWPWQRERMVCRGWYPSFSWEVCPL